MPLCRNFARVGLTSLLEGPHLQRKHVPLLEVATVVPIQAAEGLRTRNNTWQCVVCWNRRPA